MDRIKISRAMNRWSGGEDELLCTRIYINARLWGGSWIALEVTTDVLFLIFERERRHVYRAYIWERIRTMKHKPMPLDGLKGVQLHEWEFDHQPLKEESNEVSKCKECNEPVTEAEKVIVKKFYGDMCVEVPFCNENCATEFYVRRLREVDGR